MRNLKIIVEYDGSAYHGWQNQTELRTVQKTLEECLTAITQESPRVIGSGRTDAGVHALNQVANFWIDKPIEERRLLMAMNSILPADIVVKDLVEVPANFHARYDVKSKVYRYRILNRPARPAVERQYYWHISKSLNIDNMVAALLHLKGTQDFSAFCAAGSDIKDRTRTVIKSMLEKKTEGIMEIILEADGFLRHMVRNIVGTLVEIGKGRRPPEDMPALIQAKDRKQAGITAPPQGLFLADVKY